MKMIWIDEELYNSNSIVKITQGKRKIENGIETFYHLHFADGKTHSITEESGQKLIKSLEIEEINVEIVPLGFSVERRNSR